MAETYVDMSKHKVYISGYLPFDAQDFLSYNNQMIFNIGNISIWAGNLSLKKNTLLPRVSYFDGGSYWKFSVIWFKFLLELSGSKKDNTVYKEVTKDELDKILSELK